MLYPDILVMTNIDSDLPEAAFCAYEKTSNSLYTHISDDSYTINRTSTGWSLVSGGIDLLASIDGQENLRGTYTAEDPYAGTLSSSGYCSVIESTGDDPLTIVYNALWDLLEDDADFTSLVSVNNRIKFVDDESPMKNQAITADYPEVRIVSVGTRPHLLRTSSGSSMVKQFAIQVLTGDQRLDAKLFPLEWTIYKVMNRGIPALLELTYDGRKFIKNLKATTVSDSFMYAQLNPHIKGWTSIWSCEVEIWFRNS